MLAWTALYVFVVLGTGIEPVQLSPRDFKSLVSTNFTTRAGEARFYRMHGRYVTPRAKLSVARTRLFLLFIFRTVFAGRIALAAFLGHGAPP